MELNDILDQIDSDVLSIAAIKRFVKTARRGFRPKSPNDVDKLTRLAAALFVSEDYQSAIRILEFLDERTGKYHDGRRDLAGSLAESRLLLAFILKSRGEVERAKVFLARPELDASRNMTKERLAKYDNLVREELEYCKREFACVESDEYAKPSHLIHASYVCFLDLIVINERLLEIKDTITESDEIALTEAINHYRDKFAYYLVNR